MLCFIVLKWSNSMQIKLPFAENPEPHALLWEDLEEETRTALLQRLAKMMASAVDVRSDSEDKTDD